MSENRKPERRGNVTRLFPGRMLKRKILLFAIVAVIVVAALLTLLFHGTLVGGKLHRMLHYGRQTPEYSFDAHSSTEYAVQKDALVLASVSGLAAYDEDGSALWSLPSALSVPAVRTGGKTALAFDVGGSSVLARESGRGTEYVQNTGGTVFDADVSSGGAACYAVSTGGYKTILTVLDDGLNETYKWYSSGNFYNVCAISPDGKTMAAVNPDAAESDYTSMLTVFRTNREEPVAEASLGDQVIYDLKFLDRGTLAAVGERTVQFLNTTGALKAEYDFSDQYLMDFDFGGDGFIVLALNMYRAGDRYSLVTLGSDGVVRGKEFVGKEIIDISACGDYLAVLTVDDLTVYRRDLTVVGRTEDTMAASAVTAREDGTALLINHGTASLYVP